MEPAIDRRTAQLRRTVRGYDADAVERLLGELRGQIDEAENQVARLREDVERLEGTRDRRAGLERTLRDTLIGEMAEAERLRAAGARTSAELLAAAGRRPTERQALLERERDELRDSLRELESKIRSTRVRLRVVLERALADAAAPGAASPDAPRAEQSIRAAAVPAAAADETTYRAPVPGPGHTPPRRAQPAMLAEEWSPPPARSRRGRVAVWLAAALLVVAGALAAALVVGGDDTPARAGGVAGTATTVTGSGESTAESLPPPSAPADTEETTQATPTVEEPAPAQTATSAVPEPEPPATPTAPQPLAVAFVAQAGDCWLQIRRGSAAGEILFEGFLLHGDSRRFRARQLWVRMGAPSNLRITVDGKRPAGVPTGTADALITRDGVKVLALG